MSNKFENFLIALFIVLITLSACEGSSKYSIEEIKLDESIKNVEEFNDGLAVYHIKDEDHSNELSFFPLMGLIDVNGNIVVEAKYNNAEKYSESKIAVFDYEKNSYAYIDKNEN